MEKALRKECNRQGMALLVYKLIMNVAVTAVLLIGAIGYVIELMADPFMDADMLMEGLMDYLAQAGSSGWGYLLAIAIGMTLLLIWKKPDYFRHELMKRGRPMKVSSFFIILCLFMSAQLVAQIGMIVMDAILGIWDLSMSEYMESAGVSTDGFSMLLYVGLGAPIFEEILFRGLVMRSLEPYGKRMSIFVSALLFGFYHGNPVQTPYAFMVGLVLGYVAMEYNILWAMVLHMFNNLIFADSFTRLVNCLPGMWQEVVAYGVMFGFALLAVVMLVIKRRQVVDTIQKDIIQPWQYNGAFTSPLMLAVYGWSLLDMLLVMGLLLLNA